VAPGDVHAWAAALDAALRAGPDRWAAMGRAGRARASELYSVEAMTAATLEAYRRVLRA
jgi:glycosyltransferase involved in cell wall biosynthesis